jgi:hypothetical protein
MSVRPGYIGCHTKIVWQANGKIPEAEPAANEFCAAAVGAQGLPDVLYGHRFV